MVKLDKNRLTLISGPCAIESVKHATFMAKEIKSRCEDLDIQYIFKASWDKANRTELKSYRGYKLDLAVNMFQETKNDKNSAEVRWATIPNKIGGETIPNGKAGTACRRNPRGSCEILA